jgi:soluble lytic murein transglycosylase-like protein
VLRRSFAHVIVTFFSTYAAVQAEPFSAESKVLVPLPVSRPAAIPSPEPGPEQNRDGPGARRHSTAGRPFWTLLEREARMNGLPPDIADAVAAIESGYDSSAIGGVGEIGLMQIRPSTAAMLGFVGDTAELAKPEVNIRYGVTYLAQAWRLANGDLCRALMKYRAGHGEETMTPLSVQYCGRARAHLASVGSSFADAASVPLVTDPMVPAVRTGRRRPRLRTASVSAAFWAAQEARVRAITARVHAKWRRMAAR